MKSKLIYLIFRRDLIMAFDQDSNDSYSNWSNCDMSITDNFYATAPPSAPATNAAATSSASTTTTPATLVNPLTSRSPNPKR